MVETMADHVCHDKVLIDRLCADARARIHFVGIGGTGMSGYADFRALAGKVTSGSDRNFDQGRNLTARDAFISRGITVTPQDGSGVAGAAAVVVSAAVEVTVPDVVAAINQGVPIISRKDWLAAHYRAYRCVAITGTSGKSTVTAMVFEILRAAGLDPSLMTGADLRSLMKTGGPGNTYVGTGPLVIEADESDKGIGDYTPDIGVVLNLQRDHDEPAAMIPAFRAFRDGCRLVCLLSDDPGLDPLRGSAAQNFGMSDVHDVVLTPEGSSFVIDKQVFTLPVPGRHNVENAVAAIAAARALAVPLEMAARALAAYQGVARRYEVVGTVNGVRVVDDYAHNPAKLSALIKTAQGQGSRLILYFQPSGFGPTRFQWPDLVTMFARDLRVHDQLWLAPILYVGGTAAKDISSAGLRDDIVARGFKNVQAFETNADFINAVSVGAKSGDVVVIAGGRDPTLPKLAQDVLTSLKTSQQKD